MSRSSSSLSRVVVGAALGVAAVFACGPFFGIEVLRTRQEVLLAPPTISFEVELKALVPPPTDKLPVVELAEGQDRASRQMPDAGGPTPHVFALVAAMRQQRSGDAANSLAEAVPQAVALYKAGADSFLGGDSGAASAYFQKVLALPEQERKIRELEAHFMLGRMAVQGADQPDAVTHFEAVRALVRQGATDELGLAVASFGEQARGAWRHGAVANAVELYARQASYGSQSGVISLSMIAALILDDPSVLDRGIQDARTRRLLFICLNGNPFRSYIFGPKVDLVVAAMERHGLTRVEGAGLLASAAYSQGRFDIAQRLSALEDVPISTWVKAKLALRGGDTETALQQYERAIKTFQPSMGDPTGIRTEYAVLRVSREDYVQALDLFYRAAASGWSTDSEWSGFADYWGDAAYLAERVLTIEELRNYVDHTLSSTSASQTTADSARSRLRSVLARRLMRAGKRREAIRYFDDPEIRSKAKQYDSALNKANSWWRLPSTRAEAWFTAAKLARFSGMELLAFEKAPDFALWDGEYEAFDSDYQPQVTATNYQKRVNLYKSDDERKRVAASKPKTVVRFQYRMTAVDDSMKSADFLPARSQAFAAVLCEASRWIIDRQPERAEQVYARYLHEGAHVQWGRDFGRTCPEPNFQTASAWSSASRQAKHLARHARAHPVYPSLLALGSVAMLAMLLTYVRNRQGRHLSVTKSDTDIL